MKNLKRLISFIILLVSVTGFEKNTQPEEVKCFCGKRIRGDTSFQLDFISSKTMDYSRSLLKEFKDKFNQVIKKTSANIPKISDFEAALVPVTNKNDMMQRFKAEFDFFNLYFYFGKTKTNFR